VNYYLHKSTFDSPRLKQKREEEAEKKMAEEKAKMAEQNELERQRQVAEQAKQEERRRAWEAAPEREKERLENKRIVLETQRRYELYLKEKKQKRIMDGLPAIVGVDIGDTVTYHGNKGTVKNKLCTVLFESGEQTIDLADEMLMNNSAAQRKVEQEEAEQKKQDYSRTPGYNGGKRTRKRKIKKTGLKDK